MVVASKPLTLQLSDSLQLAKPLVKFQNESAISDLEERLKKEEKLRQELEKIRRQLQSEIAVLKDEIADLIAQIEELKAQNQRKDEEIAALQDKQVKILVRTSIVIESCILYITIFAAWKTWARFSLESKQPFICAV